MCIIQGLFNQQGISIPRGKKFKKAELILRYCVKRRQSLYLCAQDRQHAGADLNLIFPPILTALGAVTPREILVLSPRKYLEFN